EIVAARVLEIEDSDYLFLVDQRNCQLRAGFRIHRDVALTPGDVGHQDCFLGLGGVADDSAAQGDVVFAMQSFFKALRKPVLQFFTLLIEEKNAEHLVVDEAFEQFGDALEQFVQIENRRKFARDLVQQKQGTSLASDAGV